jgi:radical SAM protein with 4Fe4S-binding SPASM domain
MILMLKVVSNQKWGQVPMSEQPCRAPWDGAVIHFSGAVYPCDSMSQGPDSVAMQLGNINEQPLREILQGQKANTLRQRLLEGDTDGLLCQDCDKFGTCNLYGDPLGGVEQQFNIHNNGNEISFSEGSLHRLELGITDLCNMKCIMCCLSRGEASPPEVPINGFMPLAVVERSLREARELASKPPLLLLHWVGEPLIHPDIERILEIVAELDYRLHLVTNGISLHKGVVSQLLSLSGEHTINVSLNAVTEITFRRVNQSSQREKVLQNLDYFLEQREEIKADNWAVIVSSVVLQENFFEMPQFVAHWKERLEHLGETSIGLNGKGEQAIHQIQLLCELDNPISPVYFRETLRKCSINDDDWKLDYWKQIDGYLLGKNRNIENLSMLDAEQSKLLLQGEGWTGEELFCLLKNSKPLEEQLTPILRKLAFNDNRTLPALPFEPEFVEQILLWMKLVPSEIAYLSKRLKMADWKDSDTVKDLAAVLHWHHELVGYLPDPLPLMAEVDDASVAMIYLASGKNGLINKPPLQWQLEALAGILARNDGPDFSIEITTVLPERTDLSSLLLQMGQRCTLQLLRNAITVLQINKVPQWQVRALRRRWMFGNSQVTTTLKVVSKTIQGVLLALLIEPITEIKPRLRWITKRVKISYEPDLPQDLAEILLHRPQLEGIDEWNELLLIFKEQLRCPILMLSSPVVLGIVALLVQSSALDTNLYSIANKKICEGELENWQLQQWRTVKKKATVNGKR